MVGILIICHGGLGECLIQTVTHMLGSRPPALKALGFTRQVDLELLKHMAREAIAEIDSGKGVIILTDIYGATPSNLAGLVSMPGRVEAVAGVSVPMLIRTITYRNEPLATVVQKAIDGATNGVVRVQKSGT